ncbi:MAG: hypothetical protein ABI360_09115 [Allobranchiibius sp.]
MNHVIRTNNNTLNDTSMAIIARLQQDGRTQRLVGSDVLQIVAVTDPAQVGSPIKAWSGSQRLRI